MKIRLYTDGAARGNPGPAGIGIVLFNEHEELIEERCEFLGTATNNVAEYQALLEGLKLCQKYAPCSIDAFLDSELLVEQMRGNYRVKSQNLLEHYTAAQGLVSGFENVTFTHITRDKNTRADKLANKAINIHLHSKKQQSPAL